MKMIFLFIDGLGLGEENPAKNPLYATQATTIQKLLRSEHTLPTDACLDVKGLPQSATGQTAIFTGVNASKLLGRHLSGQPTASLKEVIIKKNLFSELVAMGFKVTNANVYRQEYLDQMLDPTQRRCRPSVTSVMTLSAGLPFRTVEDYKNGQGIYHDITGEIINQRGYDAEIISPKEAAKRLYHMSQAYDLTLFEHFMTDIVGHGMDMTQAILQITLVEAFLKELLILMDFKKEILFITSDHGNIEDMSVKTHTMNKVPTIILGDAVNKASFNMQSLTDIMPLVLDIFKSNPRVET